MSKQILSAFVVGLVVGVFVGYFVAPGDPNRIVQYGETSGLPKNCRAIVQANIDGYRNKVYSADDAMASLERNCGTYGVSW